MYYPCSEYKVTAMLIRAFVFAYAACWFSDEAAQLLLCVLDDVRDFFCNFGKGPLGLSDLENKRQTPRIWEIFKTFKVDDIFHLTC